MALFCNRGGVRTVEARQFRGQPMDGVHLKDGFAFVINARREAIAVYPGDWIITDADGYYPMDDRDFRNEYEPMPRDAIVW